MAQEYVGIDLHFVHRRDRSPTRGHPIKIVVADGLRSVEHLGNAGRPHALPSRINTDHPRPTRQSVARALTRATHTGNAGTGRKESFASAVFRPKESWLFTPPGPRCATDGGRLLDGPSRCLAS